MFAIMIDTKFVTFKGEEMNAIWIILGIIILLAIVVGAMYNSLVTLRVRVDEAWSDITVQLK